MFPFPQVMKDPSRQDADFYPESLAVPEKPLICFIQLFSVNSGKLGQGNLHFIPQSKPFNTRYVILFLNLSLFLRPIYPPLLYLPCQSPCPLPPRSVLNPAPPWPVVFTILPPRLADSSPLPYRLLPWASLHHFCSGFLALLFNYSFASVTWQVT